MTYQDETTDERLAEHRCVECGKPLRDDAASDVFCGPECQWAWHFRRNGDPPYSRPEREVDSMPLPMPAGSEPADLNAEPWYRPSVDEANASDKLIALPADLRQRYRAQQREAWARYDEQRGKRPGMYAPLPIRVSPFMSPAIQLGKPLVDGAPALRSIDPEPMFTIYPWPDVYWLTHRVQPWWGPPTTASAPRIPCPCGHVGVPAAHHPPGAEVTCPGCGDAYPGGICVPLVRCRTTEWELRVVTHFGSYTRAVDYGTDPAPVWSLLYAEAEKAALPRCHVPGCGSGARWWYAVGAALVVDHYMWTPTDNEVLRVGLCTTHDVRLRVELSHAKRAGSTGSTEAGRVTIPC